MIAPAIVASTPAPDVPLPDAVRTMIDAAYRSGDDKVINAVLGVAKSSFPDMLAQIDAVSATDAETLAVSRREAQERQQARIAEAPFYDLWKGELEGGASRSTGSSDALALYAAGTLTRDGIAWRQKVSGRIDFQKANRVTTAERAVAAWQPQYKFSERLYATGIGQYEHDRFLGYSNRFTLGAGLGYRAIALSTVRLDLEGGPAVRRTDNIGAPSETTLAGRASLALRWTIAPNLSISQDGAVYIESRDSTATSTTALDTKLIGALKARFSYNVQYERNAPDGSDRLDTISRATLVYAF